MRNGIQIDKSCITWTSELQGERFEACPSAHTIRAAIDKALDAKEKGDSRVILFNLSGHGYFDLSAYQAYLSGQLQDHE